MAAGAAAASTGYWSLAIGAMRAAMLCWVCLAYMRGVCDWLPLPAGTGTTGSSTSTPAAGLLVLLAAVALVAGWFLNAVRPPPPTPCGTPGGPPVTAPRVRMRDGRYMAYAESGVSRDRARFKVVYSHGFSGGRMDSPRASQVGVTAASPVSIHRLPSTCMHVCVCDSAPAPEKLVASTNSTSNTVRAGG